MNLENKTLNQKNLYFKISDGLDFNNAFVVSREEGLKNIDFLFDQYQDRADGDSDNELCVKVVEMTESEFKKAQEEFTGF